MSNISKAKLCIRVTQWCSRYFCCLKVSHLVLVLLFVLSFACSFASLLGLPLCSPVFSHCQKNSGGGLSMINSHPRCEGVCEYYIYIWVCFCLSHSLCHPDRDKTMNKKKRIKKMSKHTSVHGAENIVDLAWCSVLVCFDQVHIN